ncbi:MAG: hypothetical protein AAGJ08_25120 [Cyanobacteria bacterium P01_H01_bin.35]
MKNNSNYGNCIERFGEIHLFDERIKAELDKVGLFQETSFPPNLWAMHDLTFKNEKLKVLSFIQIDFTSFSVETESILRYPKNIEISLSEHWLKRHSKIVNSYCNSVVKEAISRVEREDLGSSYLHETTSQISIYSLISSYIEKRRKLWNQT